MSTLTNYTDNDKAKVEAEFDEYVKAQIKNVVEEYKSNKEIEKGD